MGNDSKFNLLSLKLKVNYYAKVNMKHIYWPKSDRFKVKRIYFNLNKNFFVSQTCLLYFANFFKGG